jgi:hypothetical protein
VNIHSKVVAHVDINGSMIIKFWLVLNFTKFKFIFSLDLESKCWVTKLSNAKFSYGKIEVLYILKNYGYKMEVVPYRFTCSLLQTSWKPPWTKYGEQLIIFFPIFFLFAIDRFTMKNSVYQNHATLQLKFQKKFIYNYCATIPQEIRGINYHVRKSVNWIIVTSELKMDLL